MVWTKSPSIEELVVIMPRGRGWIGVAEWQVRVSKKLHATLLVSVAVYEK